METEKFINQVCTPEQAVKLKELGVDDRAPLLAWKDISFSSDRSVFALTPNDGSLRHLYYPAYTVAELGEMLPYEYLNHGAVENAAMLNDLNCGAKVTIWRTNRDWRIRTKPDDLNCSSFTTEAQARAAFLIALLENAIISPSKTPEQ